MATAEINGLRKAAVMLIQMGRENSSLVLSKMRDSEVEELTAEIVRLQNVDSGLAGEVVDEFYDLVQARRYVGQGGLDFARAVLENSVGRDRALEIMERFNAAVLNAPFHFLHQVEPRQVLGFLQEEHPQIIALVLAHLSAERASAILSELVPETQADVAHRIAVMDRTSPEIVRQVEATLERKLSGVIVKGGEMSAVGGLEPLVEIINRIDRPTERLILESLEERDPELAEEIRSRMFMFEDITTLDDRAVQLVLRQVETADLATALKGVREDVREKVMGNLSDRATENLREEIELLGPVRLRTVEEAQAKVVQVMRTLEESGQIVVRRGGDDEFVS
jgi:flagellar motor switch protein FliG